MAVLHGNRLLFLHSSVKATAAMPTASNQAYGLHMCPPVKSVLYLDDANRMKELFADKAGTIFITNPQHANLSVLISPAASPSSSKLVYVYIKKVVADKYVASVEVSTIYSFDDLERLLVVAVP